MNPKLRNTLITAGAIFVYAFTSIVTPIIAPFVIAWIALAEAGYIEELQDLYSLWFETIAHPVKEVKDLIAKMTEDFERRISK